MKIIDRIEELNSGTDNIDYQNEAKALKAKLNKTGQILYIISIVFILLSVISIIGLVIYAIIEHIFTLLHLIPIFTLAIFGFLLIFSIFIKNSADSIIINEGLQN